MHLSVISVLFQNDSGEALASIDSLRTAIGESGTVTGVLVVNDDTVVPAHPGVTVHHTGANIGFAAGNAVGAQLADGEMFLFINPDCRLDGANAIKLLNRARVLGERIGTPLLVSTDGRPDYRSFENWTFTPGRRLAAIVAKWFVLRSKSERLPRYTKIPGTALVMSAAMAQKFGGPFDSAFFLYGEDRDLTNRARREGVELVLFRDVQIVHVGGVSGRSVHSLVERAKRDSMLRIARRRFGPLGVLFGIIDLYVMGLRAGSRSYGLGAARQDLSRWLVRDEPTAYQVPAP